MLPFVIIAIGAALAGAGVLEGAHLLPKITQPATSVEVYQLGNAYGAAKGIAVAYAALPKCAPTVTITISNLCHDKALLRQIDTDVHLADSAYTSLVTYIRANPGGSDVTVTSLLGAAKAAVENLENVEAQYGIK